MSESDAPSPPPPPLPETPDAAPPLPPPSESAAALELPAAEAPVPEGAPEPTLPPPPQGTFWGTGRRKTAVARVRLTPGTGKIVVNHRDVAQYFTEIKDRAAVTAPLEAIETAGRWDIAVNVVGGGPTGQSGAIRLGVARALLRASPAYEARLREPGFLTRDARKVERKKYGHRKARRSFQFSKR